MQNIKELLPIGSVIRLRGAKKSLMICGVCQTEQSNQTTYDYIGVLWPEGYIGNQSQILFNHVDIERIEFTGHVTAERDAFLEKLDAFYESR